MGPDKPPPTQQQGKYSKKQSQLKKPQSSQERPVRGIDDKGGVSHYNDTKGDVALFCLYNSYTYFCH